ncbi:MAG: zinc-binding dehydrogenase [Desulfobacterales bacterium]|nr:zinc-binding dehydrogenase [Desulfobacterales bacterium]
MAIQVAKLAGARVLVVAGDEDKAARARELGADAVIDRSRADWVREVLRLDRQARRRRGGGQRRPRHPRRQPAGRGARRAHRHRRQHQRARRRKSTSAIIFGKQISLIGSTMGNHQDFRTVTDLLWQRPAQARDRPGHAARARGSMPTVAWRRASSSGR